MLTLETPFVSRVPPEGALMTRAHGDPFNVFWMGEVAKCDSVTEYLRRLTLCYTHFVRISVFVKLDTDDWI